MIYGLHVQSDSGYGAVIQVELGWTAPPPVGATWSCCRRDDMPSAEVIGHDWAGFDGDPDVWVLMSGDRRLVGHLIDRHGFAPIHR